MIIIVYPLVTTNIVIEDAPFKLSFPINSRVIVHSYVNIYQRVIEKTPEGGC